MNVGVVVMDNDGLVMLMMLMMMVVVVHGDDVVMVISCLTLMISLCIILYSGIMCLNLKTFYDNYIHYKAKST